MTIQLNSNDTTGFLGKMSFVDKFDKTVGLDLLCTVAVSLKCSFSRQDELDWDMAGVLCSDIPQNRIDHVNATSFPIAL